jgi:hypothetical protein
MNEAIQDLRNAPRRSRAAAGGQSQSLSEGRRRSRPTSPEEFARPSGNWLQAESNSNLGVPMPLAAMMVTSAY